jgi:glycine/D-amino acid oxidase-like deaminating enzyme
MRQAWDGTIVVGGCRRAFADSEIGYDDRTTSQVQGALERFACEMFGLAPDELNITGRWAGTMGFSPDGLPLIGPVLTEWPSRRVWFCGGFTGHGMSLAYRTSLAAIDCMLDDADNPLPLGRAQHQSGSGVAT